MTGFVECPVCRTLLLSDDVAAHEDWHRRMRIVASGIAPNVPRGQWWQALARSPASTQT